MTPLGSRGHQVSAALSAALFVALLLSFARVDHVPAHVAGAALALAVLAALRPATALLLVAALVPVAWWIGRRWHPSVAWAEVVVVAFAAGYSIRGVAVSREAGTPLDLPVCLSAVVISASLIVQLLIDVWRLGADAVRAHLWQLLAGDYFVSSTGTDSIDVAMRLLESLLLFRAATSLTAAGRSSVFAARFARWFVTGAALAAAVTVARLWESAARADAPVATFARYVMTLRTNVHYGDLNAAGSYFVMMLFPAIALLCLPKGKRWIAAALLVAAGAWMAGSRAAYVSGLLAIALPIGLRAWRANRRRAATALLASAVVLALAAGTIVYYLPHRGNQQSIGAAIEVRRELIETSLRMVAWRPVFGVGLGQYPVRSGEFSSPTLLALFPPARRENAHNNFLQILSELGVVGFAAIGWVLWMAGSRCLRLLRTNARDPLCVAMVTGALSFVITWLGGHPLLVDEPALTFWLLLGVAAGWGTTATDAARTPSPSSTRKTSAWFVVAPLLVFTAASVPFRVRQDRANVDLEHRGIGVSAWHDAIDGVRYRLAGAASSVFVPAGAQWVTIPLRAVQAGADIRVELRLDGRAIDIVSVPPDRWLYSRLVLPRDGDRTRFRRLDLRVAGRSTADPQMLRIGKVEPR